mgnify:CR=1 FL=1
MSRPSAPPTSSRAAPPQRAAARQSPGAGTATAPPPADAIPKGLLGVSVWVTVLLDKFLFYRSTYHLLDDLRTQGLDLSQGTLTDGLQRLLPSFEPPYDAFFKNQLAAAYEKATGIKIAYARVSVGSLQTRVTTAADNGGGPDMSESDIHWAFLFEDKFVDGSVHAVASRMESCGCYEYAQEASV